MQVELSTPFVGWLVGWFPPSALRIQSSWSVPLNNMSLRLLLAANGGYRIAAKRAATCCCRRHQLSHLHGRFATAGVRPFSDDPQVDALRDKVTKLEAAAREIAAEHGAAQAELQAALAGAASTPSSSVLRLGGQFVRQANPTFLEARNARFEKLLARQKAENEGAHQAPNKQLESQQTASATTDGRDVLTIRLPSGETDVVSRPVVDASPVDLAALAGHNIGGKKNGGAVVARLRFSSPEAATNLQSDSLAAALCGDDSNDGGVESTTVVAARGSTEVSTVLWDLTNPVPFGSGGGLETLDEVGIVGVRLQLV